MRDLDENNGNPKQRHGCVTAWLILIMLVSAFVSIIYFFAGDLVAGGYPGGIPQSMLTVLGILGIGNVIFAILLFQWKKVGFWGFVFTYLASFAINMYVGLGLLQSLAGLIGLAILYGILQLKIKRVSGWDNLD